MGKFVWRISNNWEEVKPKNTEFNSVIEDWEGYEMTVDNDEFRRSLVGNFLVQEMSSGQVLVLEYETQGAAIEAFNYFQREYETIWAEQD